MIRVEDYTKAKSRLAELEKEYQEQASVIRKYEEEQKRIAFENSKKEIEQKLAVFWKQFYELAYKAVVSRSGSPGEFMAEYNYPEHKLKSLLRFKISSGDELLQFVKDCGMSISIGTEVKQCLFPYAMSSEYSEGVRMFKRDFSALCFSIYSKVPQYTFEELTGYETRKLKWLYSFNLKSERELVTLLYVFKFKMIISYKADQVIFCESRIL